MVAAVGSSCYNKHIRLMCAISGYNRLSREMELSIFSLNTKKYAQYFSFLNNISVNQKCVLTLLLVITKSHKSFSKITVNWSIATVILSCRFEITSASCTRDIFALRFLCYRKC